MKGKTIEQLHIGDAATFEKTVTESDVCLFAGITGDFNPVHVNEVFASQTRFSTRIAHGMLTASFVSTVLGMALPGPGAIYLGQTLKFTAPTQIGDTVQARAEVIEIIPEKNIIKLSTTCTNQHGTQLLEGVATIMPAKE